MVSRRLAGLLAAAALAVSCWANDRVVGPVGEPASEVPVGLTEWSIVLGEAGPVAGEVTLLVTNAGATAHDLAVEGELGDWQTPLLDPGESSELPITVVAGEVLHIECTVPGHHGQGMHMYLRAHEADASTVG